MSGLSDFTTLLAEDGPWTFAYTDGEGPETQTDGQARLSALRDRLVEEGAPDADVDAVMGALDEPSGLAAPSARYVVARGGEVVFDAAYPGERRGAALAGHDSVPPVLPVLRHAGDELHCLVVEASRGGATLRWARVGGRAARIGDVEGSADYLTKVQTGGLSHARFQRSAEEAWKLNQREVAGEVDRLVRERRPAFVVVAGDVRARQLLWDDLEEGTRELVVEVDAHTRAAGSDDDAVDEAIEEEAELRREREAAEAKDLASAGRGRRGARGVDAVVDALQQAQVATLVLDARMWESDAVLDALAAEPWVADGDPLGVGTHGPVSVPEALARAALLTDARVLVEEDDPPEPDAPREERDVRPPLAVLRWPGDEPGSGQVGA